MPRSWTQRLRSVGRHRGGEARALELALEFREKSPDYEETTARIAATLHSGRRIDVTAA